MPTGLSTSDSVRCSDASPPKTAYQHRNAAAEKSSVRRMSGASGRLRALVIARDRYRSPRRDAPHAVTATEDLLGYVVPSTARLSGLPPFPTFGAPITNLKVCSRDSGRSAAREGIGG